MNPEDVMRNALRVGALLVLSLVNAVPVAAQAAPASKEPPDPPNLLVIYREEVRPGRGAAHSANEQAWAAAFTKGQAPERWLGMTTVGGPNEAWFLSGHDSYAAWQKTQDAMEGNAALTAEGDKYSALDGELLNRTSTIVARYRSNLSYQSKVAIPQMRYMQVDVVQVRPGHAAAFNEAWEAIVASHGKAKMNEHWAVYTVDSGMPAGTYLFLYPHKSLDHLDGVPAMHNGAEYRDAIGESGRARQTQMVKDGVASQQTLLFAFRPRMSLLPKDFIDQDAAFWTPKPPPAPAPKKPGDKQ
jgi:hypothetical protein